MVSSSIAETLSNRLTFLSQTLFLPFDLPVWRVGDESRDASRALLVLGEAGEDRSYATFGSLCLALALMLCLAPLELGGVVGAGSACGGV